MFYHILFPLHQTFSVFNVFRYLTFRTAYAALTALLVSILVGPYVIRMLKRMQVGQVIRQDGPKSHYSKAGTPTMGGLLIIGTMTLATLLWANLTMPYVWVALLTTLAVGSALGTVAVLAKHELLLLVIGGLFVIETLSVIIQVASFKLTGRRVFRMAPLHHHFEAKGWQEPKVIVRFWIIAITLALFSLSTLKLR